MGKLIEAIYFATTKHQNQKRRDNTTPYISHPLAVALLLSEITHDQDLIVAGLLHDVIEDSGVTAQELQDKFGPVVTKIVVSCTEDDSALDWQTRKRVALEKIKDMNTDTALVKTADILHNLFDSVQKANELGPGFFDNFHTNRQQKMAFERDRFEEFKQYHPDNPLLNEIEKNLILLEEFIAKH